MQYKLFHTWVLVRLFDPRTSNLIIKWSLPRNCCLASKSTKTSSWLHRINAGLCIHFEYLLWSKIDNQRKTFSANCFSVRHIILGDFRYISKLNHTKLIKSVCVCVCQAMLILCRTSSNCFIFIRNILFFSFTILL